MRISDWSSDVCSSDLLEAGVDIELPSGDAYLEPLAALVTDGTVPVEIVDRAVLRALKQKEELGLLEPEVYEDAPPAAVRSEERGVGKEGVSTCRSRGSPCTTKKHKPTQPAHP